MNRVAVELTWKNWTGHRLVETYNVDVSDFIRIDHDAIATAGGRAVLRSSRDLLLRYELHRVRIVEEDRP